MQLLDLHYKEPSSNIFEYLLYPVLLPVKFIQALNTMLIDALWGELMKGERDHSPLVTLFGIAFFFVGSLYCYKYEEQLDFIVVVFTVLVIADKLIIRLAPFLFERRVHVSLKEQENGIIEWKSTSSKIPRYFKLEQVENFFVRKHEYQRGLLLEEEIETWELILSFRSSDNPPLEIYESQNMSEVQNVAIQLSQKFGLEWKQEDELIDSGIKSQYAAAPAGHYTPNFSKDLKFSGRDGHFSIKPRLRIKTYFSIFSKAFKEAGFILFLVILASFTKRFGKVLAGVYGPAFGVERPGEEVYIVDSIFYFFKAFKPDFDPVDFFELGVALLLIILYIAKNFKSRSLVIQGNVCHARNGSKIASFRTDQLKVKIIDPVENQILLHDNTNAIILNNFGNLEDGRRLKRFFSTL